RVARSVLPRQPVAWREEDHHLACGGRAVLLGPRIRPPDPTPLRSLHPRRTRQAPRAHVDVGEHAGARDDRVDLVRVPGERHAGNDPASRPPRRRRWPRSRGWLGVFPRRAREGAQTTKEALTMSSGINHQVGIKASPEAIFKALTDTEALARWWTTD